MRALVLGLVVSIVLLLGSCGLLKVQSDKLRDQRASISTLTTERDAARTDLVRVRAQVSTSYKDAQQARQELKRALENSPGWAAEPVPDAVRDSLCQRIKCAEPRTVPAPAG